MPVKPGEELGFVKVLRNSGLFPLPVGLHRRHPGRRYATPFLVVPAVPSDPGTNRSLPAAPARLHFPAIHVLDSRGNPTITPIAGQIYTFVANIVNRGSGGAYTGIAEFYVGHPESFDEAASTGRLNRAHGYNGFIAMPNSTVRVRCPTPWRPTVPEDITNSVLVQIYDLCLDRLTARFNARTDRHVGRQDLSDFSGTWEGTGAAPPAPPVPGQPTPVSLLFQVRLAITQSALDITTAIFQGGIPGSPFPNNPQHTATGRTTNGQVQLNYTEPDNPNLPRPPLSFHQWTLTLPAHNTLHFEHRIFRNVTEPPGRLFTGDLHRV